ncbi:Serine/arginine repetitive matrix protein 2, putative [Theobroma cacao]|uniref:Serine/arginine repetitive matrix protein 2, putative n=1 Tax=Theobroma cacao TaxID=3641 RepID=A0A061GI25_THECC|nr:Serine/arginine repetitive matrix protein 2, putative [Theobroma cacao]
METQRSVNNKEARNLSPCSSGRRSSTSSHSSSPEFEFWMVRNPSFPQPDLISADELFVNGVLLPLHLIPNKQPEESPRPEPNSSASEPPVPDPEPEPGPLITSEPITVLSASKRWRDIFKKEKGKNGAKHQEDKDKEKEKEKEKKKEKKSQSQSGASPAELNINIWPFSRSRSSGTSGTRPRMTAGAAGTRKVSSAPCSRSNSAGESKSRKWPSSPSRAGVHLGRSSPVWQVRRGGSGVRTFDVSSRSAEKSGSKKEVTETRCGKIAPSNGGNGNKAKVLNLNVPMCIGYRHHLSCRTDENSAMLAGVSDDCNGSRSGSGGNGANGRSSGPNVGSGSNFFNLRNLFTKKVY